MKKKLQVGVLIDSFQIPNWAYTMIEKIVLGDYAEICLIIENELSFAGKKNQHVNLGSRIDAFLFSSYCKLDQLLNKVEPNAFELKDLHLLAPEIPRIAVTPTYMAGLECFNDADCEKIHEYNLDVLVALGFGVLSGKVLYCAKYGVWSYQHGDNGIYHEGAVGFWEVFEGRGETGSALRILTEEGEKEVILCRSLAQTSELSVARNNNNNFWKTATFIPRKLRELHTLGEKRFLAGIQQDNQHPVYYSRRKYIVPQKFEWPCLLLQHLKKFFCRKIQDSFCFNQYILLCDVHKSGKFSSTLSSYKKMIPPHDRFWADPFVIYETNTHYVFIEELLAQCNKGHISYFTIDEEGNPSIPKMIIENHYHMSYPFVFSHNLAYYMIAETGENKTIDLYRCIDFPEKWEKIMTLMSNVQAYDATIFQKDGKWWLFANIRENEGASSSDELFLFYADDLFSENWQPHLKNPIVSDVTSARPAGKIFNYNGNTYRPAQNSSIRYGYGMKLNRIVTLTETEYKEECVGDIEPLWDKNIIAVHTLNFVDGLTIIDGLIKRSRYPAAIYRRLCRYCSFIH